MKSKIYKSCKTLAKTALAASLSVSLLGATAFAQKAPAKPSPNPDIELQKVDGPRKTGRKRVSETDQQPNNGQKPGKQLGKDDERPQPQGLKLGHGQDKGQGPAKGQAQAESAKSQNSPTIRRLDADKVQELRTRIRTERSARIRDGRFQEERTKNIRRLVQIERVRQLAEDSGDQALLERANQLRDKEIQRHTRKLVKLRVDGAQRRRDLIKERVENVELEKVQ